MINEIILKKNEVHLIEKVKDTEMKELILCPYDYDINNGFILIYNRKKHIVRKIDATSCRIKIMF